MAQAPPHEPQVDPTAYLQQGGIIEDWDAYEELWRSSFRTLRVTDTLKHTTGGGGRRNDSLEPPPNKQAKTTNSTTIRNNNNASAMEVDGMCVHPLLTVDPAYASMNHDGTAGAANVVSRAKQLERHTEILMESLGAPACFVAPAPVLAAFACGRQTCTVIDVGSSGCRVTPIVDGLILQHSQRRNGRGGDWLGNIAWKALPPSNQNKNDGRIRPRYQLRPDYHNNNDDDKTATTTALHRWAMQEMFYELRTTEQVRLELYRTQGYEVPFLQTSRNNPNGSNSNNDAGSSNNNAGTNDEEDSSMTNSYKLPDGTVVDWDSPLGKDLSRIPELLFADQTPFVESSSSSLLLGEHKSLSNQPLHKLVHESLSAVGDADVRKDLCGNMVLVGASSLFPNTEQRLSHEISSVVTGNVKCRVVASRHTVERSCASWIGGSILTSLGSFQQLWLSKSEYEEYGAKLAIQRFP